MERKKQRISDLFYDNRFLMAFSVLFALIAWLIVATEFSETQNTISNVPVQINYSNINDVGLKKFPEDKTYTVDVTIKGKRYIVESDDIKDDILVVADTGSVNKPDIYSLNLTVSSKSVRPEYEFVSVTPQVINEVTFDYEVSEPVKLEPELVFKSEKKVLDGYEMGEPSFTGSYYQNTVNVSGPKTEVEKVHRVIAKAELDGDLYKKTTVEAKLIPVDENGNEVPGVKTNVKGKVIIEIPVFYRKQLNVTCSFSNPPTEYIDNMPFEVTVSPSSAMFAIYDENIERDSIEIAKIDFSKLDVDGKPIRIPASEITLNGAELLDDEITEFVVTVNVTDVAKKTFRLSPENVKIQNIPDNINVEDVEFSSFNFTEITVIGPVDKLAEFNDENIVVVADFGGFDGLDTLRIVPEVPIIFFDDYCWCYGEYTAEFIIK